MGAFSRLFGKKESTEERLASHQALLAQLREGTHRALRGLDETASGDQAFWRRTFVQYFFATVDAKLSVLRLESLRRIEERRTHVKRGRIHFLKAVDYKGPEHATSRDFVHKPTTRSEVNAALQAYSRSLLAGRVPDFESVGFRSFESFLNIRQRIIHPRQADDVVLTDACIDTCRQAWTWFHTAIIEPCQALELTQAGQPARTASVSSQAA